MDVNKQIALYQLQNIIEQHPQDVALLFKKYGIAAQVTADNLANAIIVHKDIFIEDLFSIVEPSSNADGDTVKKTNFFDKIKNIIGTVKNIAAPVIEKLITKKPTEETKPAAPKKEDDSKIFGIDKTVAISVAVILFLVTVLVIVKKSENGNGSKHN